MALSFICTLLGLMTLLLRLSLASDGVNGLDHDQSYSTNLTLLVLVPFPDERPFAGWDRGLELLPAARLARDHINNQTDLLQGYKLQLIEESSDACGISTISTALIGFVRHSTASSHRIIGVAGLACSSVTASISPLAGRNPFDYLQVSMSNSPVFQSRKIFPHLWRVLPSSNAYVKTVIALMDQYNWTRIATVYDGSGVFFATTAALFVDSLKQFNKTSVLQAAVEGVEQIYIESVAQQIVSQRARIIFLSVSMPQSKLLLCEALYRGLLWPDYAWIIAFHSNTTSFLEDSPCGDRIIQALEGVFLIDFQLRQFERSTTLVSGITYDEYEQQYKEQFELLKKENQYLKYKNTFRNVTSPFANPMYDEVFAFALALNYSLSELSKQGLNLEEYNGSQSQITEIIEAQFPKVSFSGATGYIKFDENREALTPMRIYNVTQGVAYEIGVYYTERNVINIIGVDIDNAPKDDIETHYHLLPLPIQVVVLFAAVAAALYTTAVLILVVAHRKTKEIKAISPTLSILIFLGCYFVCLATITRNVNHIFKTPTVLYRIFCYLDFICGSQGQNIILSVILLKLARIYHIFNHFGKVGKFWSDKYLFAFAILLIMPVNIYLIIWFTVEIPQQSLRHTLITTSRPHYIEIITECRSKNFGFWVLGLFIPTIVLLVVNVVMALMTRKIDRKNFKDTKKITAYVYCNFITMIVSIPSWVLLNIVGLGDLAHLAVSIGFISVILLTVSFLFLPKVIPLLYKQLQVYIKYKKQNSI